MSSEFYFGQWNRQLLHFAWCSLDISSCGFLFSQHKAWENIVLVDSCSYVVVSRDYPKKSITVDTSFFPHVGSLSLFFHGCCDFCKIWTVLKSEGRRDSYCPGCYRYCG